MRTGGVRARGASRAALGRQEASGRRKLFRVFRVSKQVLGTIYSP